VIPDLLEDCQRKCREEPKYLMSNLNRDQELVRAGLLACLSECMCVCWCMPV